MEWLEINGINVSMFVVGFHLCLLLSLFSFLFLGPHDYGRCRTSTVFTAIASAVAAAITACDGASRCRFAPVIDHQA